jgi:hypothetical protein
MSDPDIIGEISKPDVHDGTILKVQHIGATTRVLVKTYEGQLYAFQFDLVESIKSFEPEGMMIYSLIKMRAPVPFRRFVFTNWAENASIFEVIAQQIEIDEIANEAAFELGRSQ